MYIYSPDALLRQSPKRMEGIYSTCFIAYLSMLCDKDVQIEHPEGLGHTDPNFMIPLRAMGLEDSGKMSNEAW